MHEVSWHMSCHVRSSECHGGLAGGLVRLAGGSVCATSPFTYVLYSYVRRRYRVIVMCRPTIVPPRPSHPDIKEGICAEMRRTPTAACSPRTRRNNDADGRDPVQNSLLHRPVTQFHPDVSKPGTSVGKPSRTSLRWAFLPGLPALAGYWYF